MAQAHIVLGLGFGDEGKGLTTDFLVRHSQNPIVVRFSGGQQAGHTVMIDGVKHIHSSYGSGTLRDKPSYFTEHTCFFLNSIALEQAVLVEKGIDPILYVHPLAKMTTPYDVMFGRAQEKLRQHGSVGLGIGATMHRHNTTGYKLHAVDLLDDKTFLQKLFQIREYYLNTFRSAWDDDTLRELNAMENRFLDAAHKWPRYVFVQNYDILNMFSHVIFEGSQGIMLDKDHGIFPNVTYANTTSKNAVEICNKLRLDYHLNYVTRCYQTRHGNGWMSSEKEITLVNNEEEINHPNEWQGTMRVRELDYNLINQAMNYDRIYSPDAITRNLIVTCMDQRPDFKFKPEMLAHTMSTIHYSYSPESKDLDNVQKIKINDLV